MFSVFWIILIILDKATKLIEKTILNKKTIFVCGNGGSSAIANHYVCDYIKSFTIRI